MLKLVLFVAGVFALFGGVATLNVAQSAIHEIEAFLLFIISAISLSGVAVTDSVDRLRKEAAVGQRPARAHDSEAA